MFVISPLVITLAMALAGAAVFYVLFRAHAMGTRLWALGGGAAAGAIGTQVFMQPLGYCSFETERLADPETATADVIFGIILIAVGVLLVGALVHWFISRVSSGQRVIPRPDFYPGTFTSRFAPLLAAVFLLPTIITLIVFHYYPLTQTFRVATRIVRLGAPRTVFTCMNNFIGIFNDGYWYTLFITVAIAVGVVVVGMSIALLIAQMANQPIRGANIYRALLIWPVAISPVVAGVLLQLLLNPVTGVVNHLIEGAVGVRVPWLGVMPWAAISIILTAAWNQSGFNILFYIAGLQNVDNELLEAAAIDGANPFQAFFRITLPLLSPFTFFLIVTNTIYAFFHTFGVIDVLTQGGPARDTATAMYMVYVVGVESKNLGRGAAQSIVLFVMVVGITILQFRSSRDRITYGV